MKNTPKPLIAIVLVITATSGNAAGYKSEFWKGKYSNIAGQEDIKKKVISALECGRDFYVLSVSLKKHIKEMDDPYTKEAKNLKNIANQYQDFHSQASRAASSEFRINGWPESKALEFLIPSVKKVIDEDVLNEKKYGWSAWNKIRGQRVKECLNNRLFQDRI